MERGGVKLLRMMGGGDWFLLVICGLVEVGGRLDEVSFFSLLRILGLKIRWD